MQNNKRIRKRKKTRRRKEVPGVNRGKIGGQSESADKNRQEVEDESSSR
jgi:hypothetical protein